MMQVASTALAIVVGLFALIGLVAGAFAAFGIIKKGVLEFQKTALETLTLSNKTMTQEIVNLKAMAKVQDTRIFRMEIESERKDRKDRIRAREIELLESAVQIALDALVRAKSSEAERVTQVLAELRRYRSEQTRAMQEWDETQRETLLYLGRHVGGQEDNTPEIAFSAGKGDG